MSILRVDKTEYYTRVVFLKRNFLSFYHYYRMEFEGKGEETAKLDKYSIIDFDTSLIEKYQEQFEVGEFQKKSGENYRGYIAMDKEHFVGYICGRIQENVFYIKYIYVSPEYRGHGYSKELIAFLKNKLYIEKYYLYVRPNNIPAVKSYLRAGGVIKQEIKYCMILKFLKFTYYRKN